MMMNRQLLVRAQRTCRLTAAVQLGDDREITGRAYSEVFANIRSVLRCTSATGMIRRTD